MFPELTAASLVCSKLALFSKVNEPPGLTDTSFTTLNVWPALKVTVPDVTLQLQPDKLPVEEYVPEKTNFWAEVGVPFDQTLPFQVLVGCWDIVMLAADEQAPSVAVTV